MNKSRIFGGFSLVEMMLLLLIVSLMIASSVAVISKRHIKVPRLAMHGAYMCYYRTVNNEVHLFEERYVGSGLSKKVVERDLTLEGLDECSFTPPDKISYLHIQATGGGGGGGDSGYRGGDIKTYTSATEVISPFGITEDFLELKGITTAGDPAYANLWGQIHAYANGTGDMGSAGDGGDLWYIKEECSNGMCLAKREWENKQSNTEKTCWNQKKTVTGSETGESQYRSETRTYRYNCKVDCGASDNGRPLPPSGYNSCNADCYAYQYKESNVSTENDYFKDCNGSSYKTEACTSSTRISDCDDYYTYNNGDPVYACDEDTTDCAGEYLSGICSMSEGCDERDTETCYYYPCDIGCYSWTEEKDSEGNPTGRKKCNYPGKDYINYCKRGTYHSGYCESGTGRRYQRAYGGGKICKYANMEDDSQCGTGSKKWTTCDSRTVTPSYANTGLSPAPSRTCTDIFQEPQDAITCTLSGFQNQNVIVTDYYQEVIDNDKNDYPSYRIPVAGSIPPEHKDKFEDERKISRPVAGNSYTICNYGNTTLYPSVDGIFGSFIIDYDGVNVDCTADGLSAAFGEGIYVISNGTTTNIPSFEHDIPSSQYYDPLIEYDVSEKWEKPFGETVLSITSESQLIPQSPSSSSSVNYKNPFTGVVYTPYQRIPTQCNLTQDVWNSASHKPKDNTEECDKIRNLQAKGTEGNVDLWIKWSSKDRKWLSKEVTYKSTCKSDIRSNWQTYDYNKNYTELDNEGEPITKNTSPICMLNFNDYDNPKNESDSELTNSNNGNYTKDRCSYIPEVVKGGVGGEGASCTLPSVQGGVNVQYRGYGGILPGIRGSNFVTINPRELVKMLYTKTEYETQKGGYAENGTDSLGYAKISLGVGYNVDSLPTCILHNEATNAFPTKGTGARKISAGATTPQAGTNGRNGRAEFSNGGYNAGLSLGSNQVGYRIDGKANPENYKYQYYYTWDTNFMQYGEGGEAGEYIVKVVRAIKDKELRITVGRGGAGGTPESGEDGQNGGDTVIEDVLIAKGGKGGLGGQTTPVEQLPYWQGDGAEGWDYTRGKVGTPGGKHEGENVKSNIMNLILPVDNNFTLQKWVMASGEGGNGGGSQNTCWASEWVRYFENEEDPKSIRAEDVACRQGKYWSAEPNAEAGIDGLVLIRW